MNINQWLSSKTPQERMALIAGVATPVLLLALPITHKYGYTIPPGSSKENPSHINCRAAYPRHID
ncbi:MAG: hypothetical protein JMN25_17015 [gamma proteobacterium endosymbiont of Lamellibrachia anaximandri]|nr:hypothetical protein [gamma proteobacterium endosymbiont of Lamellibrachia anaximandri]